MNEKEGWANESKQSQSGAVRGLIRTWKSFSSATRGFSVQRRGREIRENACTENFSSANPDGAQILGSQNLPLWVKSHATFIYYIYSCFSIQIFEEEILLLYASL